MKRFLTYTIAAIVAVSVAVLIFAGLGAAVFLLPLIAGTFKS